MGRDATPARRSAESSLDEDASGSGSAAGHFANQETDPAPRANNRFPLTFAGLPLLRPHLMGIVNVTPDSFSDGGETLSAHAAIDRGFALLAEGADILDVGGESTRPGADPVSVEAELARVLPVVEAIARAGALVSVDTRRTAVMRAAIDAGARIINDISALGDAGARALVAKTKASVVLMHMQGEPRTMQRAPSYSDPAAEIAGWLRARVQACLGAGIPAASIAVDPGIGFGKTPAHNLHVLGRLGIYRDFGCAVVIGVSRKSLIARLSRDEPPKRRVAGSLAAAIAAVAAGAHILRVHDVAETRQALSVWNAIAEATPKD